MTKILITGATGFVGANLAKRLLQEKHDVHCLMRSSDVSWRLCDIAQQLRFHVADLRDADGVRTVMQSVSPAHIFHLATAGVYRGKTVSDRELFETNTVGLVNLLEAAKNIPYESFVNTGSSSEYGVTAKPMQEDDMCKPASVYGISKLAATHYASIHAKQFQKPVVTLRLFSPYGPYDFEGRFMAYAVVKSLRNEALQLGNPESRRDFVYVEDVVDAYISAMSHCSAVSGEIINISSGEEVSIREVANRIQAVCGSPAPIQWGSSSARRLGESPRWQADVTKAEKLLGWRPKTTFSIGLEATIQWFRMNISQYENV